MTPLKQSMRWFGPTDGVSLSDIRQAGAAEVVTALHEIPNGEVWPIAAISERKRTIQKAGLDWTVVESVPVHEEIKLRTGDYLRYIENYKQTIANLAEAGIRVICYNFMPVLDWTRTDLEYKLPDGSQALRFEFRALAAFDCFILNRKNAREDYTPQVLEAARSFYTSLTPAGVKNLQDTILAGLPGAEEGYSLGDFQQALSRYEKINAGRLAEHLNLFLEAIIPVAERCNIQMAIHPDDPPFSILGLPRVVSTSQDVKRILQRPDSPANGLTLCTGSFGVRPDLNLPEMIRQFGERIHFVHLRSTQSDAKGNFYEASHLEGDVPMYEVVKELMKINANRNSTIPMRPDHGHGILDDLGKRSNPGYTAIGRLKGLAELRGLMHAISLQV